MKIIGLSGYARAGKDTVAGILYTHGFEGRKVTTMAFADPMRDIEKWYRGDIGKLRHDNPECYRADMQLLGQYMRDIDPDIWVKALAKWAVYIQDSRCLVITDVRYPNEMHWIHSQGGEVWWVDNHRATKINDHESEQHYETIKAHANHIIDNSGTLDDLEATVVRLGNRRAAPQADEDPLSRYGGPRE